MKDFKKLGLENEKLKKGSKGKASNSTKKMKIKEDKKTKELQKKVEILKKQVRQTKNEVFEALSQWKRSTLPIKKSSKRKMLK